MIVYYLQGRTILIPAKNQRIILRNKELKLWHFLIEQCPNISSRKDLGIHIWEGRYVTDFAINQTINSLRRKIGDTSREIIVTVPKKGYTINAERVIIKVDDETELIPNTGTDTVEQVSNSDKYSEHKEEISPHRLKMTLEARETASEKVISKRKKVKRIMLMIAVLICSYIIGVWFSVKINEEKKEETLYLDGYRIHSIGDRIEYFHGEKKTVCYRMKSNINDNKKREYLTESTTCKNEG
ncbi:transcriptional regulator [Serratia marcescens]|uniref:transcriptional regulator n=1 Tax=Serratia marcescens TaxID=615 RepID=UPI00204232EF|nr:winged helix-turn-helix domain-containing protein [Serratia marcescens]MCM2651986.1 winged helix-turn-helix domain-containing protein [Serratia marcescens]